MIFDYLTYKLIWWAFVAVLLIGFALLDGWDFGIAMWLPWLGKNDVERRVILNTIGPTWEGNQTWFITAGGALFAAWPLVYAAAFSSLYIALLVLLFALFLRPVGFDYRSKLPDPRWRQAWDWGLCIGGTVPPLIFGVAFANVLTGLPFRFDDSMRLSYSGWFGDLFHPFSLLCGVLGLSMLTMQGMAYLGIKTEGAIAGRGRRLLMMSACLTAALFLAAGWYVATILPGYRIDSMPDPQQAFMPIAKTVSRATGAWLDNYQRWPLAWALPALGVIGALTAAPLARLGHALSAFLASSVSVAAILLTAGVAMFPFVLPSSLDPASSITAWDAVSSHRSLAAMFWVVVLLLPLVVMYSSWIYAVMRGKVTDRHIEQNEHEVY